MWERSEEGTAKRRRVSGVRATVKGKVYKGVVMGPVMLFGLEAEVGVAQLKILRFLLGVMRIGNEYIRTSSGWMVWRQNKR